MGILLHYENINGECQERDHKGWIVVRDFKWLSKRDTLDGAVKTLEVTRYIDSSSVALLTESTSKEKKEIKLRLTEEARAATKVPMEYIVKGARITHYKIEQREQDSLPPIETIIFQFEAIEAIYTPYDERGNAMAPVKSG